MIDSKTVETPALNGFVITGASYVFSPSYNLQLGGPTSRSYALLEAMFDDMYFEDWQTSTVLHNCKIMI